MHRLINALLRQPVDRPPIWIMRQAGRYLPEYRELRTRAGDFLTLCKTPELAAEATLQPLARYDLDAAIVFSDILTIPDAMGLGLSMEEGIGPRFKKPLTSVSDIEACKIPNPQKDLGYVMDTIRLVCQSLENRIPVIGFSGSPWTLAAYMVEGQGSRNFAKVKTLLYNQPNVLHQLLSKLQTAVTAYLNAQIAAGASAVMIFDTWGGILSPADYRRFSLDYMQAIVDGINRVSENKRIPITLFTKGGGAWLEWIADTGCDAIGLDWTVDVSDALSRVGNRVALQGNLDPAVMRATPQVIAERANIILNQVNDHPGFVFNLGHGIEPDIPPEHVSALVETVTSFKPMQ